MCCIYFCELIMLHSMCCPESFETVSVSQVICMLYNKMYTDGQINVLCGTVGKNRVEKRNIVGDIHLQGNQCSDSRSTLNLTFSKYLRQQNKGARIENLALQKRSNLHDVTPSSLEIDREISKCSDRLHC